MNLNDKFFNFHNQNKSKTCKEEKTNKMTNKNNSRLETIENTMNAIGRNVEDFVVGAVAVPLNAINNTADEALLFGAGTIAYASGDEKTSNQLMEEVEKTQSGEYGIKIPNSTAGALGAVSGGLAAIAMVGALFYGAYRGVSENNTNNSYQNRPAVERVQTLENTEVEKNPYK
jgi:hypothetical protein